MAKSGVRSLNGEQFYYAEGTGGESLALGINSGTGDLTLAVKPTPNATSSDTALISIESALNGNINLTPNGSGNVVISSAVVQGGTIDNTAIGATTPSTGDFSSLSINGVPVTSGPSNVEFAAFLAADATNQTGNGNPYQLAGLSDSATITGVTNTGAFDITTGIFTAPVAGTYMFGLSVVVSNISAAGYLELLISKQASSVAYRTDAYIGTSTSAQNGATMTCIMTLAQFDGVFFAAIGANQGGDTLTIVGNALLVYTGCWGKLISV